MAARAPTPQSYRSDELGDVAQAIGRLGARVGAGPGDEFAVPRLGRILVAVDGSPASRHALAWAAKLAKGLPAHVTVVSVAPSPEVARALSGGVGGGWQAVAATFDEVNEQAQKDLAKAGAFLKERGIGASLELQRGRAAHSIVEMAASDKADLVILGSHGHGLGERLNLGSVGSAVKHHVACSVLVARGPPEVKRALLATDGSQRSRVAVQAGLAVAQALGARPVLAHVVDLSGYGLARSKALQQGRLVAAQQALLADLGKGIDVRVAAGPPAKRLRRMAEDEKAGLVVLGSRGLGGLSGLTLGSVSDALTHKAKPSVLVVKPASA